MGKRRLTPEIITIERQEQLNELCDQCRLDGRFAFDTEFVMEDRYETEVCLLQIATGQAVALVDPFQEIDLDPFWSLVSDDQVETVVHAGQEDLALCAQHTGNVPRRIYDVQIAAGFAGHSYPLSLQKLVQTLLHVRLHKSKTLTDWRKRPLSEDQVQYAAEDVSYLLSARERLGAELARRNRSDWAQEEFARFEEISLYRRAEEEKLLRLKGSGALKGRQLAVVRELLVWREELAERLNRPVRVMLKDHLLVEIAKFELSSFNGVRDLRGLNLSDKQVQSLCRVVTKAVETPRESWPVLAPRDTETPREGTITALITAVIRGYCMEHEIAYGLVASKKTIHELIRHCERGRPNDRAEVELLNGWRRKAIGEVLTDIIAGRKAIRIDSRDSGRPLSITDLQD